MKKIKDFILMVNKDNDPRFNSRAFYFITDKGEIRNHIIYVEFSALINNGEGVKLLQTITVEQLSLALVDKNLIFSEMVNKFFYFVEQKYGDVTTVRSEK